MINVAIVGYGNLGKGVKRALENSVDIKLTAVSTRRPEQKKELTKVQVPGTNGFSLPKGMKIDVAILYGGSKKILPSGAPFHS